MKTQKTYYHVIENGGYGRIGWHGYYDSLQDAKNRVDELSEMFTRPEFYVEATNSKKEPNFITI